MFGTDQEKGSERCTAITNSFSLWAGGNVKNLQIPLLGQEKQKRQVERRWHVTQKD